jgi:putative transposase
MSDIDNIIIKSMAELYHVLNRGVDKRKIFMDDKDYFRFIHDLFEFNDEDNVANAIFRFRRPTIDVGHRYIEHKKRKLLVDVHAFCLMPNHYHLLLSSRVENGIPLFMKKLNGGYAKYFNARHERTGTLFERRYKSVSINNQAHFIHLPYYIHLNPLDMFAPEWRERKLKDYKGSVKFLNSCRWSSHLDYLGEQNFPSLTSRDFLLEIFGGEKGYKKKLDGYLKDLNLARIRGIILE